MEIKIVQYFKLMFIPALCYLSFFITFHILELQAKKKKVIVCRQQCYCQTISLHAAW
jgi:hypothetical protein